MADNEETPPAAAPKPPARRAPRKSTASKSAPDKPASKPRRKPAAAKSESAAEPATVRKPPAPPKPRSTKRATPPPKRPAKPKAETPPESEKTPVWKSKAALAGGLAAVGAAATAALLSLRGSTPKKNADQKPDGKPEEAAGEGTSSPPKSADDKSHAHMPDGQDATDSFEAGIADENIIPDEIPNQPK
ncbi:hypothetical protein [Sphingomonas sp. IC4-52]|uniref:hypothetical protein n=1 Tax=Sphingomonas sp. IC4-52 TaxID=2887202 RepID=UPI001D1061BE|nr:hypothetical protein [Sphingomonas sp. IC4-52]MCC2978597.1 hypothetical protein [Sphingomonas sp. IC4-52]